MPSDKSRAMSALYHARRAAGLCVKCTRPSANARCDRCRQYQRVSSRRFARRRRLMGLCYYCGAATRERSCDPCREQMRVDQKERRCLL